MDHNRDSKHDNHEAGHKAVQSLAISNAISATRKNARKRRFVSVEELTRQASVEVLREQELGQVPVVGDGSDLPRRDFMKVVGATFAAASVTAACARLPERYARPYVQKPEELTPGRANWYATACRTCSAGCGLLVKSRDGRPIKVEGNAEHPVSKGGVCAAGQAGVLDLYDGDRLRGPTVGGAPAKWEAVDAEVAKQLAAYATNGKALALVTGSISGPASKAVIAAFQKKFPGAQHVVYEADPIGAIAAAHALTHSKKAVPGYSFDRADYVVSFGADYLGTWLQPAAFTKQWAANRVVSLDKKTMSRTVQLETHLSLTGSNADERVRILPSEQRDLVLALASKIGSATGADLGVTAKGNEQIDKIAKALLAHKGKSIVVTDSDDVAVQGAVAFINEQLGNYGKTLDLNSHLQSNLADTAAIEKLLADVKSGAVTGLILVGVNPAYDSPTPGAWAEAIKKATFSVALSQRADETAKLAKIIAASSHALESWGDLETISGTLTVQQPLVNPLFDTRQAEDSLLLWAGALVGEKPATFRPFLQETWKTQVTARAGKPADFLKFWDKSVHDGYVVVGRALVVLPGGPVEAAPPQDAKVAAPVAAAAVAGAADASPVAAPADASPVGLPAAATPEVKLEAPPPPLDTLEGVKKALATPAAKIAGEGKFELVLFPTVALRQGQQANNPFLHEMPDPITKSTWGNYAMVSPKTAAALGVASSDVLAVKAGGATVELPVVLAPGLHDNAIALPLGFGRTDSGKIGNGLGKNVRVLAPNGGTVKADVSKTGAVDPVAFSQVHHSYEHRDSVRETSFEEWAEDPKAGNETLEEMLHQPGKKDKRITRSIWNRHEYPGHKWGMAIDLNKCTGCGSCVVSCNIENNIPVVGKAEVLLRREMHWMRIDRYYSEREAAPANGQDWDSTKDDLLALADNPEVVHMPMLCQQCDNAPCETVCPVLATVHSSEGLNTQAYNRCIGTRYCANNCPYKVRRFNWFNYPHGEMEGKQETDLVALALNPDVVKRARGVMEKCSFCVQRIQEVKALASREGRIDQNANGQICKPDEVKTACQQSCPADAITFGDMNAASQVKKLYDDPRNYSALVEIGTQPAVTYMTKVRNSDRPHAAKHGEKNEHGPAKKAPEKAEG